MSNWNSARAPDGRIYYYDEQGNTSWDPPPPPPTDDFSKVAPPPPGAPMMAAPAVPMAQAAPPGYQPDYPAAGYVANQMPPTYVATHPHVAVQPAVMGGQPPAKVTHTNVHNCCRCRKNFFIATPLITVPDPFTLLQKKSWLSNWMPNISTGMSNVSDGIMQRGDQGLQGGRMPGAPVAAAPYRSDIPPPPDRRPLPYNLW